MPEGTDIGPPLMPRAGISTIAALQSGLPSPAGLPGPFLSRMPAGLDIAEVEDQLAEWAQSHGLLTDSAARSRFSRAQFGQLASLVYPEAGDLISYAKWIAWLFLFDDYFDEHPDGLTPRDEGLSEGVSAFMPLPDGHHPPQPASIHIAALSELWEELSPTMPVPLQTRFRRHVDEYVRSYDTTVAASRNTKAPELSVYIRLRRSSGAVDTCLDLIERQPGAYLTPAEAGSPVLLALREAANDVICWTNDITSVHKEAQHGELNNLVTVMRHSLGIGWPAAFDITAQIVASRTREFQQLCCASWPDGPSPALVRFIEGVRLWISGSHLWHQQSSRYAGS
ncbi:terpene synthase family protein [Streptomyces sp.]|uniref:terpene synthase family protein n=1 Tax=Streptomyces sp. TaxID=1931 RepID=UPI002F4222C3